MLFYAHSGLRYLVLFAGILVLGYAVYGQATKREYDKTMRILAAVFTGSIDLTVLFGFAHLMSSVFYPQLSGHIASMVLAMVVALPLGLFSAIYLSEYAPDPVRRTIKPILEILAGIPTVVYGYFALLFVTPLIRGVSENVAVFNALSASIVMGIMIWALSNDFLRMFGL